ncbi:MAG: class I SAM-dependent methyltransferase [Myxococcota bacterium]
MVAPSPSPQQIVDRIAALLALPRADQVGAARALIASLPSAERPEAWNSTFGPGSLFEAWTETAIARSVHRALASELAPIAARPGFRIVDIGGGNGSVWRSVFDGSQRGELVVVDLLAEAIESVRAAVPAGVEVRGIVGAVQDVELPACDALVCSMTLHHVAGRDAEQRRAHGLEGPGKLEVLRAFGAALEPREGLGFLVEADVDCDLDLPPGSPELADNILDSYLRRCGRAILEDLADPAQPESMRARWRGLLRYWFLEQLAVAELPVAERDVYELTVPRWKALVSDAGLTLDAHRCLDDHALFQLYRFRP